MFELATDPLGLPIEWYYEYAILAVIGAFAFRIAYAIVGDMYRGGWINGSLIGSFFHWLIRFVVFAVLWAIAYGAIKAYFFVTAYWQIIVMIAGSILGTAAICALTVFIMRTVRKQRTVNGNA